ncbi:MAG: mannose-1-phosphate guanylyltransferase [Bacillota bacterium]|nr:mannose-1-phosphate guanylyltransferase [Thermoanaerobacteraceae bacterium]
MPAVFAVILAGGSGERFWPLSSKDRPKQFLNLIGERTMLQQTVDRLRGFVEPADVYVVTGRGYGNLVKEQVPEIPEANVIEEPCGRDTAAAAGLAAVYLARRDPQGAMIVLPADHYIADTARFRWILEIAVDTARSGEWLVTLGITPTRPETGYGYIQRGEMLRTVGSIAVYRALRFTEKPDQLKARRFLASGKYFWNSGMFIWRVNVILALFAEYLPELAAGLKRIAASLGTEREAAVIESVYPALPRISVDYGVMEQAKNVVVLPADFGWDDVGTWPAWARYGGNQDGQGNVIEGSGVLVESSGCVVRASKHVVGALGIRDIVIVEEDGRLLVCAKERAQEIKRLVAALKEAGYDDAV